MASISGTIYRFGGFELDASERTLMNGEKQIQLAPRVFDTLRILVEHGGHVLSKERMLAEVWEDSFVEENNLAQNISLLRKILTESSSPKFIETVPKFGYRFVTPVEVSDCEPETTTERVSARVTIRDVGDNDDLGSGLSFEEYGVRSFTGIDGEWRLFTVLTGAQASLLA